MAVVLDFTMRHLDGITLAFLPGRTWEGTVEYIYPSLDPVTRTLKARLRFDNPVGGDVAPDTGHYEYVLRR